MSEVAEIRLLKHFEELRDPRQEWKISHLLSEILLLVILGVICGAETFSDIEIYGKKKLDFLQQFSPFLKGIPSEYTLQDLFARLNPRVFEACFSSWVSSLKAGLSGEIVAIDGKCLRKSFNKASGQKALHLVSAWACKQRLSLTQVAVDSKSNEIKAIPELVEMLVLKGAIVTIDAMGCQSDIANAILEQEADYMLSLKGNQETLHDDVKEFFEKEIKEDFRFSTADRHTTLDKGHGRVEKRKVYSTGDVAWLGERHPKWGSIASIVAVCSERTIRQAKTTETRFYVSSLMPDAKKAAEIIRSHWGVENQVHWVLDVVFKEDDSRIRAEDAPRNFAVIRKIALNLIRLGKNASNICKKRASIQSIRKMAGWDDTLALQLLTIP
jgi:predicted transposase YbfD/YdcC